jgi:hypothetical protein
MEYLVCSNPVLVLRFCQLFFFGGGDMEYNIFSFADVKGHPVTLEPDSHFSQFRAHPSGHRHNREKKH